FPQAKPSAVSPLHEMLSVHWLKKTLQTASAVIYPTSWLQRHHDRILTTCAAVDIVPHIGWSTSSLGNKKGLPVGFELVHAGKLGSNDLTARATDVLPKGLAIFLKHNPHALRDTRLTLVGPED